MWEFPRTRYADCNGSEASEETEISVNIGGVKHTLYGDVLNRYPETRLAELLNRVSDSAEDLSGLCDDYDDLKREFYFDRDPKAFKCILELYYYGEIHMKRGICPMCFMKEMDYWGIDEDYLDECCRCSLNEVETELAEIAEKVKTILDDLEDDDDDDDARVSRSQRCQTFLWKLMEKPESSVAARVIAVVSFVFILLSSVVMCVGTIPELQVQDDEGHLTEHPTLEAIETACIIWFTVEYVLRLASSSSKLHFVFSFLNIIDFLAIMPFYVVLILTHLGTAMMELANVQQAVQALRIMRIARIFKLARHSSGLQTLTFALKSSLKELGLLLMYMSVGIFLFSALGYTMEQSHPETMFTSIPQSFWWAIITMTTVGYGDIYPKTTLGRCNAAVSFLCGVIAIALPIHPIINNFVIVYSKQRVLETAAKHEIELMALRAREEAQECPEAERRAASVDSSSMWDSAAVSASQSDSFIPLLGETATVSKNQRAQKCNN
ncbi:potassium voltage-gated channel subfamily F member 1a isoform X1 [Danio rerio]|uniref:Potassium voltage-gated channel subfamily F member 1a n=1 Tax=Danio rerio TaxID=7955 RepID=Q5SP96_DANRE|nr:potassium voltage-gated channel subfamily F member 1a [Danio rerio]XP_021324115.1 potassium voltage-gated channel, subfamily F, member 1a isoform X1 [Danio rerio]AAI63424.1 Potassium voltage-gated channel, subfamily F, member 1 [Danio rerio]AAI63435.1 Potassium voltage-gated channel, subfamily F, member 1 [Danio rerio]|eukprot:NP_001076280.1 potassium voltage-gated channel, subfamily F, member 1a [Danio rerio]